MTVAEEAEALRAIEAKLEEARTLAQRAFPAGWVEQEIFHLQGQIQAAAQTREAVLAQRSDVAPA